MKNSRRHPARQARTDPFTQLSDSPEPSESTGHRQARLERILLTELASLLRDEASDPALDGIRLLSLALSPDGGHARLGYVVETALEDEAQARRRTQSALQRAHGFLRARLASQLDLKRLPTLSFTFVGLAEGGAEWSE
jgi:ribosome-binding factor A